MSDGATRSRIRAAKRRVLDRLRNEAEACAALAATAADPTRARELRRQATIATYGARGIARDLRSER